LPAQEEGLSAPRFAKSPATREGRQESPWWSVHLARYLFSLAFVDNRRVLDIACGTGYGLPFIKQQARWVVGVDVDLEAAKIAQSELGKESGNIIVADGRQLPFGDDSFETITSFETLEHLENRDRFLEELARVLMPNGICVISTPNANQTLPINGKPRNPFHVHEYEPDELRSELNRHFSTVRLLGQQLNPRFAIPPFWDEQERLSEQTGMRKRILFWRALNKLPFHSLRDRVSRALWGHQFLPDETDYEFNETTVDKAPVLVALCSNAPVA
jgi:SAM-dependent methyltransferase